jgi:hypothetical protein
MASWRIANAGLLRHGAARCAPLVLFSILKDGRVSLAWQKIVNAAVRMYSAPIESTLSHKKDQHENVL